MTQINNSFGSGGMSLALNEAQFQQFVQFLKDDVSSLPIREAASHVGLHQKKSVWVLGENLQLNVNGEVIQEEDRSLIWHEGSIQDNLRIMRVQPDEIIPKIQVPLDTSQLGRYMYNNSAYIVAIIYLSKYMYL